ncbi:adrenocortical dysplasia protein homolog isoform X2 [Cottoperca gobio]|nr:uncharacterized protein LOC115009326 isoform X2 [Cottoperca gobio]XP_029289118.1 uncharacterized protein LOC115009326 isoform X2 [Cottoperca gobio]
MNRPAGSRVPPWIESLILCYGSEEESSSGQLKAHVIGVGQMSQSQAQGSEGPTGLLFLSDGVLQIPAILTASAWEHLQEQEDRECFTSLVNTTVCFQDYQLRFHMALELTKCSFFLLVGELATTAAGTVKDTTPASTAQPSIRLKICQTWRALLAQETLDSQMSQWGCELSELLGEWQNDCLQTVLDDVRERLMVASSHPVSLQSSTSTYNPPPTHPDTFTATSWAVDRVRYKGLKRFTVPIKCLLIPEKDALQLQTPLNVGSRTTSGLCAAPEDMKRDLPQVCRPSETTQLSVDDAEWQITNPAVVEGDGDSNDNSPRLVEDSMLHEDTIAAMIDSDIRPLSNPWDIFPPPCETSSSSDASSEATPTHSLHNPISTEFKSDNSEILTSNQLPLYSSKVTSDLSKGEHSFLPPYQKAPQLTSLPATACSSNITSVSPPELFTRPSHLILATDKHPTDTAKQNLLDLDQEAQISESPPSWIFDTHAGSSAEGGSSNNPGQTVGTVSRKSPTVHSDGRLFSYSYQVSGQNLQDFSRFSVAESCLHWAVKYLVVPKQTNNPHNTSVTSNEMSSDGTEVTSLSGLKS